MRVTAWVIVVLIVIGCAERPPNPPMSQAGKWEMADNSRSSWFESGGAHIQLEIKGGEPSVGRDRVLQWVKMAAKAVGGFYGRFPVKHLFVAVNLEGNGHVEDGKAFSGSRIQVRLGSGTSARDLNDDWVLTHEMFHLGFPDLGERYLWMNEGLSDYLEPVARARLGTLTEEYVWKEWVEGFPQGQPEKGDRGLDNTHTWGRTYWGGTMFWLLADVRFREQTHGTRSLDDAVKAILGAGGDGSQRWELVRVIEVGDRATGTMVLRDLHQEMGERPDNVDLNDLWKKLGVRYVWGRVGFDDSAPLAWVRKAITAKNQ